MIEHLFIGAVIGALVLAILYLLTRPYHEDKKDDFLQWKQKVLVMEAWKETQEANHKASMKILNDHGASLERFSKDVRSYETSAAQIHNDYVMLNCHIASVERRYADLVPVHRHYYLTDEMIKIKRVTNERHGRNEEKVSGEGKRDFAFTAEELKFKSRTEANDPGRNEERSSIPSYCPPDPGTMGTKR